MSDRETNAYDSEYGEESFDEESIDEASPSDNESISEVSTKSSHSSIEEKPLLHEEEEIKERLTDSDKVSYNDEDNETLSLSSERNDNAVFKPLDKIEKEPVEARSISNEKNLHEIDESESDENATDVEIVENLTSPDRQSERTPIEEEIQPSTSSNRDDRDNGEDVRDDIVNEDIENLSSNQSEVDLNVTSQTPTSFNSDNHAFHMDIIKKTTRSLTSIPTMAKKPNNRKSLSFTNERMREIERDNQILLRKILTQKPRKESVSCPNVRTTSSAVNRKKQQRQIDLDNQVLKRKIEAISLRRPVQQ